MRHAGRETIPWILIVLTAGLDRLLKFLVEQPLLRPLGWRWFGLEQFHNVGIAFNIPLPLWLILPLTLIFLIVLFWWVKQNARPSWAYAAIALGALSNAFDRIFYNYTVDYWRILTGIINLADILIVVGLLFLLRKKNN